MANQPSFDQFFAAIAGQESGGNYGARNSRTGALGKYQIMPANVPAWSKKYLGQTITASQFLASPALQEQLAGAVLKSYYNQYGARGAAAAWYSGSPKKADNYTRFRSNEPSVGEYVDSVIKRAGGITPSRSSAASGASGGPLPSQLRASTATATTTKGPVDWSKVPSTYVDNTVKDSPLPTKAAVDSTDVYAPMQQTLSSGQSTSGDVFSAQAATLKAGTAPGVEIGTTTPQVTTTPRVTTSQAQAAAALGPVADEGTFNAAKGIGTGSTTGVRGSILSLAKQYLGTPYKWGGTAPGGFDCSGLIQYVLQQNGITVPRVSYQQARSGTRTDISKLQPGDLVAWDNSSRNSGADHIAFYLGDGKILEAPKPGTAVRIRTLGAKEGAWGVAMNY